MLQENEKGFNEWIAVLDQAFMSIEDQDLFFKGIQKHPEWMTQTTRHGWTPLIMAAMNHHPEAARALIKEGVNLNAQDEEGSTALMTAVYFGCQSVMIQLMEAGADVNLQNSEGWTPLMLACRTGALETVKALLKAEAKDMIRNQCQKTAWDIAKENRDHAIVNYLEAVAEQKRLSQTIKSSQASGPSNRSKKTEPLSSVKNLRL